MAAHAACLDGSAFNRLGEISTRKTSFKPFPSTTMNDSCSHRTPAELTQAFEKTCGQVPSQESLALVMEPHPSHVQVVVDRIVLRVRFLNDSVQRDKFIVLQLASGC